MKISVNKRSVNVAAIDSKRAHELSSRCRVSPLAAHLMLLRGVETQDDARNYLQPRLKNQLVSPLLLNDMAKALERVTKAITQKEKIALFFDYDVDGATSSSIIRHYFDFLNVPLELYVPDRIKEGYGPNNQAMDALKQKDVSLVLMLDCGTNAFTPLAHAKCLGMDVIVLDHHLPEDTLPEVFALINPNRKDQDLHNREDLKGLCTAGVAFIFLVGLQSHLLTLGLIKEKYQLLQLLDIVALGTVCDVMPLTGLNRAFVKQGLQVAEHTKWPGLVQLAASANLNRIDSAYHFGFVLGPRINAGGRVGKAHMGSDLLSTHDTQLARELAHNLESYNQERIHIERAALEEATQQAENQKDLAIIVVAGDWHPGVIGIVASRLKENFQKPALVISLQNNQAKGSGRSIGMLDLGHLIHQAVSNGYLLGGGGHKAAVGFSLEPTSIKKFHDYLVNQLENHTIDNTLHVDACVTISDLTHDFFHDIARLEPYGMGNPTPRFMLENVNIIAVNSLKDQHIRFTIQDKLGHNCDGIAFRAMHTALGNELFAMRTGISAIGSLKLNTYKGVSSPNLILEDILC